MPNASFRHYAFQRRDTDISTEHQARGHFIPSSSQLGFGSVDDAILLSVRAGHLPPILRRGGVGNQQHASYLKTIKSFGIAH